MVSSAHKYGNELDSGRIGNVGNVVNRSAWTHLVPRGRLTQHSATFPTLQYLRGRLELLGKRLGKYPIAFSQCQEGVGRLCSSRTDDPSTRASEIDAVSHDETIHASAMRAWRIALLE
jgi:hypothetical protein